MTCTIHPEVQEALRSGHAVVALESAVITAGLPRQAAPLPAPLDDAGWDAGQPCNLELARAMERTVRAADAIPATIAVLRGALHIGLDDDQMRQLATDPKACKASSTALAALMASGDSAGTTVSGTLAACALTQSTIQNPRSKLDGIRVFATGGIGGVHRGWQQRPDISADLRAIAATPVCVVCSGGKSILDLPATLESLETLGVPVIGYGADCFPQFQCPGADDLPLSHRVDSAEQCSRLCALHWSLQGSGVIVANPVPPRFAMDRVELEAAVREAEALAASRRIGGSARTPFLLAEVARLTANRSLHANLALLINNAKLAAEVAVHVAAR